MARAEQDITTGLAPPEGISPQQDRLKLCLVLQLVKPDVAPPDPSDPLQAIVARDNLVAAFQRLDGPLATIRGNQRARRKTRCHC